jgi:hypothetical protein
MRISFKCNLDIWNKGIWNPICLLISESSILIISFMAFWFPENGKVVFGQKCKWIRGIMYSILIHLICCRNLKHIRQVYKIFYKAFSYPFCWFIFWLTGVWTRGLMPWIDALLLEPCLSHLSYLFWTVFVRHLRFLLLSVFCLVRKRPNITAVIKVNLACYTH